jgi:hypothetical protein
MPAPPCLRRSACKSPHRRDGRSGILLHDGQRMQKGRADPVATSPMTDQAGRLNWSFREQITDQAAAGKAAMHASSPHTVFALAVASRRRFQKKGRGAQPTALFARAKSISCLTPGHRHLLAVRESAAARLLQAAGLLGVDLPRAGAGTTWAFHGHWPELLAQTAQKCSKVRRIASTFHALCPTAANTWDRTPILSETVRSGVLTYMDCWLDLVCRPTIHMPFDSSIPMPHHLCSCPSAVAGK